MSSERAEEFRLIVLARGHGPYARSDDLSRALQWTSVLEESAQVLWLLRAAGASLNPKQET